MATPSTDPAPALRSRMIAAAFALDAVLVIVFAVIGRASHSEDLTLAGVAQTAWPFLVGLVLGWLLTRAWQHPLAVRRAGIGIWALTVVTGMLLRGVSDQGVSVAFVVVASVVLLLFLVGWRTMVALVRRRRSARADLEVSR